MDLSALQALLRGISVTDIAAFTRAIQTPADYELTRTVMPERRINTVKWQSRTSRRRVSAAKYRAYDAPVVMAARQAERVTREGLLPPLGQILPVGELDTILHETSRGADASQLEELLYGDVERHVESIKSRLELAAGDLLLDGKFTLAGENGMYVEYDAGVPTANMPTAATVWSNPAADALADEMRWIEHLRSIGAPRPARVLTSYKVRAYLAGNQSYRAAYYGATIGANLPTATLAPNEVDAVRARYGLPPITDYDVQVDVDGVAQRVLPENVFVMLPPNPTTWAETQYGTTAESLILSGGANPSITRQDAPGIVVTTGVTDNPVSIYTKGAAVAMPVMYVPDIHVVAKVLA